MKSKKLNIIVDLDDTTVDLKTEWLALYNEKYNDNMLIADATDFTLANVVKPECGIKVNEFLTYDLFRNLKPLAGAIEALKYLNSKHTIHIVSAHHVAHPQSALAKLEWCNQHLPFLDQDYITLCRQKHLISADVIVDDKYQTIAACSAFMAAATIAWPWNTVGAHYYDLYAQDYRDTEKCWNEIVAWIDWYSENYGDLNIDD